MKPIRWALIFCVLVVIHNAVCPLVTAQDDREAIIDEAVRLYVQAFEFHKKGDYDKAIPLAEKSLTLSEKVLRPDHPDLAFLLNQVAEFHRSAGDLTRAELLLLRAMSITEKLEPSHPWVLMVLNNLGELYKQKGDYERAVPLVSRGLEIGEKTLGPEHPDVATLLNNLAGLCKITGDFVRAEALYKRALAIRMKGTGGDQRYLVMVLNNIGELYEHTYHFQLAEWYLQRAFETSEKILGPEHPTTNLVLSNISRVYYSLGDYARAESSIQRALAASEKTLGPEHPETVTMLSRLAGVYLARGDYARAEPIYLRVQALIEKKFGPEHPYVAVGLNQLALVYLAAGDYTRALALQQRGIEIEEKNIKHIFAITSQQQQQAYLNTLAVTPETVISLHTYMPKSAEAARLALTVILQRKGRVLDAMSGHIASLRRRASPEDQKLLEQLSTTLSKLANLQLSNTRSPIQKDQSTEIAKLEAEQLQLEGTISRRSAEFRINAETLSLDAVSQAIPPDAALIELFVYYRLNPKATNHKALFGELRYIAYVLRRGETIPQWADLGDAAYINTLTEELRKALRDPKRKDFRQTARALDERMMRPLRKLLGPTRRLFISPDSALNLIPFACLVDENDRYLIENYSISYLTTGRDLLRLQVTNESRDTPTVFADPQYDLTQTTQPAIEQQTDSATMPSTDNRSLNSLAMANYRPLPGTAAEASDLGKLFSDATLLTQAQATEQALKKVNRPRLLHIATHGFFLPEPSIPHAIPSAPRVDTPEGSFDRQYFNAPLATLNTGNPLMRSGLILAGVKQQSSGLGEDGILTALEVAGLNLWGTKLVVLSACETGLGDLKNGQGVYGLRRALVLAGSETQLMSLWKVSDHGTRDLMANYYARLRRDESRTEALRQVQLEMLRGKLLPSRKADSDKHKRETSDTISEGTAKDYRHPFYWASFIASGDWRSLTGQAR